MIECPSCNSGLPKSEGVCRNCGAVVLRRLTYDSPPNLSPGVTPFFQSSWPELNGTWLKLESANETGSFKDRIMRLLVQEALDTGARAAVVASSGNAAASAATYATRWGLRLILVVPSALSPSRMVALQRFSVVIIQHGEGPADAHLFARELAQSLNLPNLSSTFSSSGAEMACRTIGHEIADQQPTLDIVHLAASVSVGPVLLGASNGLLERKRRAPRLVAGQAAGCAPIARAFQRGSSVVEPWTAPVSTSATSIADTLHPYAHEASFFLQKLQQSDGFVAAGTDIQLQRIRDELLRHDGVDVELSCCAAIHALLVSNSASQNSVAVLTGSGFRETYRDVFTEPHALEARARKLSTGLDTEDVVQEEVIKWLNA